MKINANNENKRSIHRGNRRWQIKLFTSSAECMKLSNQVWIRSCWLAFQKKTLKQMAKSSKQFFRFDLKQMMPFHWTFSHRIEDAAIEKIFELIRDNRTLTVHDKHRQYIDIEGQKHLI